jgi:hypothetical protein
VCEWDRVCHAAKVGNVLQLVTVTGFGLTELSNDKGGRGSWKDSNETIPF